MDPNPYPIKVDHQFEKQYNRYSFWAALTIIAGFVVTMADLFQANRFGLPGLFGFVSFGVGIYLMYRKQNSFLRSYACPECTTPTNQYRYAKLDPNKPYNAVLFDCDQCMISWDTTLRTED